MAHFYARPAWDCDGNEAFIVIKPLFRRDLTGQAYDAWITYAPFGTKVILGQVAGDLKSAKAAASRIAREALFTPRGTWRYIEEEE